MLTIWERPGEEPDVGGLAQIYGHKNFTDAFSKMKRH